MYTTYTTYITYITYQLIVAAFQLTLKTGQLVGCDSFRLDEWSHLDKRPKDWSKLVDIVVQGADRGQPMLVPLQFQKKVRLIVKNEKNKYNIIKKKRSV